MKHPVAKDCLLVCEVFKRGLDVLVIRLARLESQKWIGKDTYDEA